MTTFNPGDMELMQTATEWALFFLRTTSLNSCQSRTNCAAGAVANALADATSAGFGRQGNARG
jgi:hypothetical protein